MVKIGPYFHKSLWATIFVYFSKTLSQNTHSWCTKFESIDAISLPHVHFHNDYVIPNFGGDSNQSSNMID